MCLGIPAEVIEINNNTATVNLGGTKYKALLDLVENVVVGDYIILHSGFAIEKLNKEAALETLEMFREIINQNVD
jgi:hydrogenase expression/formation protein HypC